MSDRRFPSGWDEQRVQRLLAELAVRTEEEWIAADEVAAAEGGSDLIPVFLKESPIRVGSPRLARKEDAADFIKEVVDEPPDTIPPQPAP